MVCPQSHLGLRRASAVHRRGDHHVSLEGVGAQTLGPKANKLEAYSVASISGTVLAVCSCSVLPMFAGIYRMGAGLGPAAAFLYAGPAINVLAIFLTARVLGIELGVARVVGTMVFGVVIGLMMAVLFRRSEEARTQATLALPEPPASRRPLWQNAAMLAAMLAFLSFQRLVQPGRQARRIGRRHTVRGDAAIRNRRGVRPAAQTGRAGTRVGRSDSIDEDRGPNIDDVDTWVTRIHHVRWYLAGAMGVLVVAMSLAWLNKQDFTEWMGNTWEFSKLLVPLLFGGVFIVGFLAALVPEKQVAMLGRRQQFDEQLDRVGRRLPVLFCHADRSADPRSADA